MDRFGLHLAFLRSVRWRSERGEVSSWLILGAGLAMIAAGLAGPLEPIFDGLARGYGGGGSVAVAAGADDSGAEGAAGGEGDGGGTNGESGEEDTDGDGADGDESPMFADGAPGDGSPALGDGSTGDGSMFPDGAPGDGSPPGAQANEPAQNEVEGPAVEPVLDPEVSEDINALIATLPDDPRSLEHERLRNAIDAAIDDPELADLVFEFASQGYPIEVAIALATGDWSGVEGGHPDTYSDDEIATVLRALGFDPSDDLAGVDELLATLDPGLLALLFHEGREYELQLTLGGVGTPGTLVLPVGASATLDASVAVSLGEPAIGVGFTQTQSIDITARVVGTVEGAAGKSTLAKVYKQIRRLGFVPPGLQDLVNRNPLLRGALRGLPFSVAYSEYAGTELAYEATLTPTQAAAVDNGDLSGLPDIFDPSSFETGNAILIRGGQIEGSDFMLRYKGLQLDENFESFDGLGFGVTVLDDGLVAIYAGDIEAVEHSVGIGLPFAQIGKTDRESEYDFDYAVLDLNTPEGQAAYDAFITGGGVPDTDSAGVTTATAEVHQGDYDLGVDIDLGPLQVNDNIDSTSYTTETLTYADGSQVTTFDASHNGDSATQVVVPHDASGQPDFDQAEVTIVLGDLSDGDAHAIGLGFDGVTDGPGELPSGNQDVQLTFTPAELIELQQIAQEAVRNTAYDADGNFTQEAYDAAIADPRGFVEDLAAAGSVQEIIEVIINDSNSHHDSPVLGLRNIALDAALDTNDFDTELPGSIEFRPAS